MLGFFLKEVSTEYSLNNNTSSFFSIVKQTNILASDFMFLHKCPEFTISVFCCCFCCFTYSIYFIDLS